MLCSASNSEFCNKNQSGFIVLQLVVLCCSLQSASKLEVSELQGWYFSSTSKWMSISLYLSSEVLSMQEQHCHQWTTRTILPSVNNMPWHGRIVQTRDTRDGTNHPMHGVPTSPISIWVGPPLWPNIKGKNLHVLPYQQIITNMNNFCIYFTISSTVATISSKNKWNPGIGVDRSTADVIALSWHPLLIFLGKLIHMVWVNW